MSTPAIARGPGYWLRSYGLMVRRDLVALRVDLAAMLVLQTLMGAGAAFIYGFVLGDQDPAHATYIATAAPVLAMIPVGFAFLPGVIGNMKSEGSYDYVWSLPVPRTAAGAATLSAFTVAALPAAALSLTIASWRYGVDLSISPSIVPAVGLTALMAASVGYGLGHAVPDPRVTNLIVNLVMFSVLMFSPLAFPIEQFPGWLGAVHQVLPFHHMATVVRAALTDGLVSHVARSYAVLAAWTVVSWAAALRVVGRRG